jgi:hypothetical protein
MSSTINFFSLAACFKASLKFLLHAIWATARIGVQSQKTETKAKSIILVLLDRNIRKPPKAPAKAELPKGGQVASQPLTSNRDKDT